MKALNKPLVIGIGGCARSGKDTFASILTNQLSASGKSVDKFAFADALKQDCDAFCKEKLSISAFTQVSEEKLLIRPLLVWYGDTKRKQTNGRYWVDIIDAKVKVSNADYCIITDIRYDVYEKDELYWLKREWGGELAHVSRWTKRILSDSVTDFAKEFQARGMINNLYRKEFIAPANDHEKENDPKIKVKADFIAEWENVEANSPEELIKSPSLVAYVDDFINKRNLI